MKSLLTIAAVGLAACAALTGSADAAIVVTYEAPGATNTTANYVGGVETFDGQSGPSFTSTFGGSLVTGNYSGVAISTAGQYGGAGGTGNYALALDSSTPVSYSLSLSTTGQPIDYFGFWLSAADPSNTVTMTTSQGSYVFSAAIWAIPAVRLKVRTALRTMFSSTSSTPPARSARSCSLKASATPALNRTTIP